jgi:hypothetical protein
MTLFEHKGALAIPSPASEDRRAVEVGRVWQAGGKQYVTLRADIYGDAAAWGIVLADLARHVAIAFEQLHGVAQEVTVARVRGGFEAEMETPTDRATGSLQ